MPWGLTKWVFLQPRAWALAFISPTKAATEPEMVSARIWLASLAETTIMQYSRCSTVMTSPAWMPAVLPSLGSPSRAEAVAVTAWFMSSFPLSMASRVKRQVMILVRLAG